MNFFPVLVFSCVISAFITYALGIFVFARNPESRVNLLFLAAMLSATYWALGEFLLWHAGGPEGIAFFLKVSAFWPFTAAFTVHFILAFTENPLVRPEKTGILVAVLYLPALAISLAGLLTDTIYTVGYEAGPGFIYLPVEASPAYVAEAFYIFIIMVFAAFIGFRAWRGAGPGRVRRQNRLLFIGIATVIGFGSLSGLILPAFGIYTPNLVFIGIVIFSLIVVYAMLRYGLFTLSPEAAVPEILRTMPDGMILADMNGRIIAANSAAANIFRAAEQDLTGREAESLVPAPEYQRIMAALRSQETVSDLELVLDRDTFTVASIAASVVRGPEGEPAGVVLIARDITERKASETALRIANEKISQLSQLTRHDISNLVTALSGYLEFLREENTDPACSSHISSCISIVGLINRHLCFAGEYQKIGEHHPVWQPLREMVAKAAGTLPHNGVQIETDIAPVEIYADPLSVKVIYNLLENALRHGGHVTRIGIATEPRGGGDLAIVFEDNGEGIPDRDKERIFRHGFGKNTGLGLSLTREILSVTGSTITETGTFGSGARFEIRVPARAWRYS
jgi:PAS domain S-box-containing protein